MNSRLRAADFQPMEKPFTDIPPSTHMICPVKKPGAGKHRNATTEETSPGSPTRLMGVRLKTSFAMLSSSRL